MRLQIQTVSALGLIAGCSTVPMSTTPVSTSPNSVSAAGHSTASVAATTACADRVLMGLGFRIQQRHVSSVWGTRSEAGTMATAYGPARLATWATAVGRAQDGKTELVVSAWGWAFPESGRGEANSNRVAVAPPPGEAKQAVEQVVSSCTSGG
jgi:hypothetical protein